MTNLGGRIWQYFDIVAITLLGVNIPATAVLEILDDKAESLSEGLRDSPVDVNQWDADLTDIGRGSAAERLWHT